MLGITKPHDFALLGLGHNGHVAFNEPGSTRDSRTRVVRVSQDTCERAANSYHGTALTVGVADIMDASEIVLLAHESTKRVPLDQLRWNMARDAALHWPVIYLREHPNFTVVTYETE